MWHVFFFSLWQSTLLMQTFGWQGHGNIFIGSVSRIENLHLGDAIIFK